MQIPRNLIDFVDSSPLIDRQFNIVENRSQILGLVNVEVHAQAKRMHETDAMLIEDRQQLCQVGRTLDAVQDEHDPTTRRF